jgi:hypothetical protein
VLIRQIQHHSEKDFEIGRIFSFKFRTPTLQIRESSDQMNLWLNITGALSFFLANSVLNSFCVRPPLTFLLQPQA